MAGIARPNSAPSLHAVNPLRGLARFRFMRAAPFMLCAVFPPAMPGCIPVPRGDNPLDVRFMTTDDFRAYAEQVFRRQNRVTMRLMMAPPAGDAIPERVRSRIEKAESRMNDACASLNAIASARAADDDVGIELGNRARITAYDCAESTRRLESLLDRHGIGSPAADSFQSNQPQA